MNRQSMRVLGIALVLALSTITVTAQGSICVSAADCCSFPSAAQRALPCCGFSFTGSDALRCDDGRCYRGDTPCKSSVDDPLCNIRNADALSQWHSCRHDSEKMRALQQLDLYGGGGSSLLVEAASQRRTDAIEWLLSESAIPSEAIHARGHGDASALHVAAATSDASGSDAESTATLQLLLASGADVNAVDAFGFTPLHRAIQVNNVESATLLLASGANLTIHAPGRETALHLAAYENSRELAQLLLAFGADPFERNERGVTSFEVGLFDLSVPPHHMT